ncbi:MAG: ABC transporter ATP-binding protein [Anaerolineae bacterium]
MTTITLEHLHKRFADPTSKTKPVQAVDDVSMKIGTGEVLALVGPSGCGKTTILRMVAGLETPDQGNIIYNHQPLNDIPLRERNIGMVFQEGALIPHWEAQQNIGFFLWLRHREQEVPERVHRIAQITGFGIEQLLSRRTDKLSGGEQQRIAIARALTRDLSVLLLDEPFAHLDAKFRMEARHELKRLLKEFTVTTIYVTHDQTEAIALAHRIAVMRSGKVEQVGTYRHLYESPLNLFIATFFGMHPINLFHGHVERAHWQGRNFRHYPIRSDLDDGTKVIMGVRPEDMVLNEDGIPCTVQMVTPFFAERHLLVEVSASGENWTLLLPLDMSVRVHDTLKCSPKVEQALYFDSRSGIRIG